MDARLATALLACASAGCLVSFNDAPSGACDGGACRDGGSFDARIDHLGFDARDDASPDAPADAPVSCKAMPDGGYCGPGDPCHDAPTCVGGVCTPHVRMDGTPCGIPKDACHTIPVCAGGVCGSSTALADGTQWKSGDDNARCCGGVEVETTTATDCGVCGLACNTSLGQTCISIASHWFCGPCSVDTQCWSGCCSLTVMGHCSPSDCATGTCAVPNVCPDGAHCQSDVVNYCSY